MKYAKYTFLLMGLLVLFIVSGCTKKEENPDNKLVVVVSIIPIQEFVEKIGGDRISVSVMVPPGASPHSYEPTPEQLVNVSKADMYVKVGSPVEFEMVWLDKIISTNRDMLVVDASENIKLVSITHKHSHEEEHDHEAEGSTDQKGYDPHIWLSPKNAKIMVENIYKGITSVDLENREYYSRNKESYMEELDALDKEIQQVLSEKTNRRFMVFHPAWGYFTKDYEIEQIPIEEEGKEPTAKGIQSLIKQAKEHNIKVIFASPQFSTKSVGVIADEIRGRMVLIDPLEKGYIANLKKVSQALSEAME